MAAKERHPCTWLNVFKPAMGSVCFQWFEEKLQEVECEEQRLRKLHAVVETLVNHRKGNLTTCLIRHTPALGEMGVLSELERRSLLFSAIQVEIVSPPAA